MGNCYIMLIILSTPKDIVVKFISATHVLSRTGIQKATAWKRMPGCPSAGSWRVAFQSVSTAIFFKRVLLIGVARLAVPQKEWWTGVFIGLKTLSPVTKLEDIYQLDWQSVLLLFLKSSFYFKIKRTKCT